MHQPELRSSQLIMSFGPGALVDLPESSVIMGGLEQWQYDREIEEHCWISESRLTSKLEEWLKGRGIPYAAPLRLKTPPPRWRAGMANISDGLTHSYSPSGSLLRPTKLTLITVASARGFFISAILRTPSRLRLARSVSVLFRCASLRLAREDMFQMWIGGVSFLIAEQVVVANYI